MNSFVKTARLALLAVFLAAPAAPARSATIKGTITVGGRPARDVVVSVEGVASEKIAASLAGVKPGKAVMDQRNMKFIPRVLPVLVGTAVDFPNNDNTFHNVYSRGGAKDFDLGLYPPGKTRGTTFEKPGIARILCNAHPNMEGFVVVKPHPYFSAVDERGLFRIEGVPVGKARLEVWHPDLGVRSETIEVRRSSDVITRDIDLKKP
ncbi:MAG TPA: hypothetical protein VNN77_16540 [candidate division Zixibacteria bacterium]|nr:hypothetical protein [candidate division Zixibacteria bacterium]